MKTRVYVVVDSSGKLITMIANHVPVGTICEAPDYEGKQIIDIDLIEILVSPKGDPPTAIVNVDLLKLKRSKHGEEFSKLIKYREGQLMKAGNYMALVEDSPGNFKFQEFPIGVHPGNFVSMAAPGFGPGDEKYISVFNGMPRIDWDKKISDLNKNGVGMKELVARDSWNSMSALERLKSKVIGGN